MLFPSQSLAIGIESWSRAHTSPPKNLPCARKGHTGDFLALSRLSGENATMHKLVVYFWSRRAVTPRGCVGRTRVQPRKVRQDRTFPELPSVFPSDAFCLLHRYIRVLSRWMLESTPVSLTCTIKHSITTPSTSTRSTACAHIGGVIWQV